MAERTNKLQVNVPVASFPSISISMGQAKAFQGIAATLGKITDTMHDQRDRKAILQGKRAGTVAGATGTPDLRGDDTLFGAAHDEAARQSYSTKVDIAAQIKIAELEAQHKADPAGFHKAATAYKTGMTQEVSQLDPSLGVLFDQTFQLRQAASTTRIKKTYSTQEGERLRGQVVQHDAILSKEVQSFAGDLFDPDPTVSTGAMANYYISRKKLEASYMQIKPDGTPIYKPEQREKALIRFDDEFREAAGREAVNKALNKKAFLRQLRETGGGVKIIGIDEDGKQIVRTFKLTDSMTSDAKERFFDFAVDAANAESRALTAKAAAEARTMKIINDNTAKDMLDHSINRTLTPGLVEAAKDDLDPTDYANYRKIALTGGAVVDTKAGISQAEEIVRQFRADGDVVKASKALVALAANQDGITVNTMKNKLSEVTSTDDRDGPKSLYHQSINGFDDKINILRAAANRTEAALQLVDAKGHFTEWFQAFPKNTDPNTGEPYNREPTREEVKAMELHLMSQAVPKSQNRFLQKSALGVSVPRKKITGTVTVPGRTGPKPKVVDGLVMTPEGAVDMEQTAANYKAAFANSPGFDPADAATWPDPLKRLFKDLTAYNNALAAHKELVEEIYGNQ